ncbi:hypothetical protein PS706_03259 [Pseudomonas fluorescens]|nr:hypothetical protein PS708_02374 [Pseudomonas fluorescens]VVO08131.1 hypothetical protein PS706_03259 [Pseudomonas fluorescens]
MVPSAAPYSVTWNTERQVTTRSPLIERAFFRLRFILSALCHCALPIRPELCGCAMTWGNTPMHIG